MLVKRTVIRVEAVDGDSVVFDNSAPLAKIRQAIERGSVRGNERASQ